MKDKNWNSIIKLKDFGNYLNNEELIQLSMSSSKFRSYYYNDIVKCFNFSPFADPRGYKSVVIAEKYNKFDDLHYHLSNPYIPLTNDFAESKNQFTQDTKMFKRDLEKMVVHNSIDYSYLLYEIPTIFPNIKTLVITNSVLTIELLQYLLDNLKYLENLDFCENILIHGVSNMNSYTIEWPAILVSLKSCDNMSINVYNDYDNIIIKQVNYSDSGASDFYPLSKLPPNLATFEHKIIDVYSEEYEEQIQFFHLNNHLKILKLSGIEKNYEILNTIREYENLTHLEYRCECYDEDMEGYGNPVLLNVIHLHILAYIIDIYPLYEMFPNVTDLVIEYDFIFNQSNLHNTIENFPKLESLKFISNNHCKEVFDFTLPNLKYLERLEINLNYEEAKFKDIKWDVSACDKLKSVTISKNNNYTPFENSELSQDLDKDWNCLYFPYKLIFIKNSK